MKACISTNQRLDELERRFEEDRLVGFFLLDELAFVGAFRLELVDAFVGDDGDEPLERPD